MKEEGMGKLEVLTEKVKAVASLGTNDIALEMGKKVIRQRCSEKLHYKRLKEREQMEIENKEENRRKRNRSGDDDDTDCEGSKARRKEVMDIASSSSSVAAPADADDTKKYDVFISFRGPDTRRTFTSHLHAALLQKKITTYIDDELKRGDEIAPALLKAIKKSELSVIIFSKDYASSKWCLDELVHVLECKEKHGQLVIPIFYDTLPSDVRNQQGSYKVAFAELEERFQNSIDKVHKWRDALTKAANISGFDSKNYGTDADLVKKVVDDIWTKLCRASSCDLKGFVGIESRIKQVESLLGIHSSDVCISVGIWGMGGIGKTTLAEKIFQKHSSKFEASCFVKNVRENSEKANGLDHLEKTLCKEILKEEGLSIGSTIVRERLSRTKVLIVLDDVSSSIQMERLVGDRLRYGTGSRIIITSRDRGTLGQTVEEDNIYEVEVLKPDDALQLFCSRAFKNNSTRITDYKELAKEVVAYAKGVPLALTVLGSLFFNCKSKEEWEDEFNKLKRFPSEDIQKVLRISYDGLRKNEKEIFLDIACFHKGKFLDEVKRMLEVRGFFARSGIRNLIEMSLISIDSKMVMIDTYNLVQEMERETIEMHDLLQEMGRKIVQEQGDKDPGKRSRLFNNEDIYRVLRSNTETPNVEAIKLYNLQERSLKHVDFKKMSNLTMLSLANGLVFIDSLDLPDSLHYLKWKKYPLEYLPSSFTPENLVELHMPHSKVKKLWKEEQVLVNLQVIDLSFSENLTEVPNLSRSLKIVEINLCWCESLVEIPSYFQHLDKLTRLNLGGCRLKYLPEMPGNIQYLNLECSGIKELPDSVWSNENISYLNLREMQAVKMLPSSIGNLNRLQDLSLKGCRQLKDVPTSIYSLTNLKRLDFRGCRILNKLPSNSVGFLSLEELDLCSSGILEIPASIKQASRLSLLTLDNCKQLQSIPKLPVLCNVQARGCTSLKIVSSSRTALTQGWDKPKYYCRVFTDCPILDNNSRSNIMDEAQITIMRMATVAPFKDWPYNPSPQSVIVCPGKEIPNWFSHQNEGSSVDIELCLDWFRALPAILHLEKIRANFIVKFTGESHVLFSSKCSIAGGYNNYSAGQHHVHVWNKAFRSEEVGKNCSPDVYKLAKEASVVFCPVDIQERPDSHLKVESCGICPLYAEDAEKFKFGRVHVEGTKSRRRNKTR